MLLEWIAADVYDDAIDDAAGKGERKRVVGGDRRLRVASDDEARAQSEHAGLGDDFAFAHALLVDIEGELADVRCVVAGSITGLAELGGKQMLAGGDGVGGRNVLDIFAKPVVDVMQLAVLQEEGVAAGVAALCEEDAFRPLVVSSTPAAMV